MSLDGRDPGKQQEAEPQVVRRAKVINRAGLHARPCHALVTTAMRFDSSLEIRAVDRGRSVNGKSILALMTLEVSEGCELEFDGRGPDAEALVEALVKLVVSGFGELPGS